TVKKTWRAHPSWLRGLAFSPDGKYLATGGGDMQVKLWDGAKYTLVRTLTGHGLPVMSVAFNTPGGLLVSGSIDGSCKVWSVETGEVRATLQGLPGYVASAAVSGDGRYVVCVARGKGIDHWDLAVRPESAVRREHEAVTDAVAFHPDGKSFVSA